MKKQLVFAGSSGENSPLGISYVSFGSTEPFGAYLAHILGSYDELADMTYFAPNEFLTAFHLARIESTDCRARGLGPVTITENFGSVFADDQTIVALANKADIIISGSARVVFKIGGLTISTGGGGVGGACGGSLALQAAWEALFTAPLPPRLTYALEPIYAVPRSNLTARSWDFWFWLSKANGVGPVTPWALGRLWNYVVGNADLYPDRFR